MNTNNRPKILSYEEFEEQSKAPSIDMTENGSCSNCGGCCSNRLPMNEKEFLRLKEYVDKMGFKAISYQTIVEINPSIDMTCPFFDREKGCIVYELRPLICRLYICNRSEEELALLFIKSTPPNAIIHYRNRFLREEIFNLKGVSI